LGACAPQIDPAEPVQSAFVQQLPGTQELFEAAQQMSEGFALMHAALGVAGVHVDETHTASVVAVLQIVAGP
jgi:hypothetical protein